MMTATRPLSAALLLALMSLTASHVHGHGILASEEQFAAGIPVTDEGDWPAVAISHDGSGWQSRQQRFVQNAIVRMDLHNNSTEEHLFAIGSDASLRDQAQMHRLMPARRSEYPNTRWLKPGAHAALTWEFNLTGQFQARCLIPEHVARETVLYFRVVDAPTNTQSGSD